MRVEEAQKAEEKGRFQRRGGVGTLRGSSGMLRKWGAGRRDRRKGDKLSG